MTEAADMIVGAFEAHGVACVRESAEVVSVDGGRLAIRAEFFVPEGAAAGVHALAIQAYSQTLGDGAIVEMFTGVGDEVAAARSDAFSSFLLGVFHPLLEALTSHACDAPQADIEQWGGRQATWKVFSGPLISRSADASALKEDYPGFLDALRNLASTTLASGPHWVRVFVGGFHEKLAAAEVLLDNEPWEAGQALLATHPWRWGMEYRSLRHFMIAMPIQAEPKGFWRRLRSRL